MKIGLLQCDDVAQDLQPAHGNYPQMFEDLLRSQIPDLQLTIYRVMDGEYPVRLDEHHAYFTTGSKFGVNDGLAWVDVLEDFVRELWRQRIPLIGVCFGHQLMAKALGGEVGKSEKGWGVGISFNQVVTRKNWMSPWQEKLDLIVSHQDQVIRLPADVAAEVLVSSLFCPYYVVQYGRHFMSVQGHPEFCKTYSRDLMEMRKISIPQARLREGQVSLNAEVDADVMMSWMLNFLTQASQSPSAT
ncbi:gamma-glutamyl-gamma-aminobutyrate hydrolase family protein [uncultured Halopseudomonas sp.]|uniref:glutamine amidotransferase-related protein n=1 Tax=uncultured Halopseudomonas sp. TaxID=2901193 RepID=UPI0030EF926E|tara:strand:- start:3213 stop:3944 length:732 start_codon:yes stop_codon:yes gene_type:complete